MSKPRIAFLCTHNSCRSQIAEALGRYLAAETFEAYSAGAEVAPRINPDAVRVLKKYMGIDMEQAQMPKRIDAIPAPDIVISMGCDVGCPYIGREFDENWNLSDPTGAEDAAFLRIIRQVEYRILQWKQKIPVTGDICRDAQGAWYQIEGFARDAQTQECLVLYQSLCAPFETWAKPLRQFLEWQQQTGLHRETGGCGAAQGRGQAAPMRKDRQKETAHQTDRQQETLEKMVSRQESMVQPAGTQAESPQRFVNQRETAPDAGEITDEALREILRNGQGEKKLTGLLTTQEIAQRGFLILLDAETYREKRQILIGLQPYLNALYYNNLAAAWDIVLEEETDQKKFETLLHYLETCEKYEGGHLR